MVTDTIKFEQLFRLHYTDLVTFCRYFIRDQQDAEDLVVDIFVKIWFKYNTTFCKFTDAKGYLYRSVYNECMLLFKRRERSQRANKQYQYVSHLIVEDDNLMPKNEISIHRAIDKLSHSHKTVIKLYYFDSLPLSKIAEQLNIPLNTVKSYKHRAESKIGRTLVNKFSNG